MLELIYDRTTDDAAEALRLARKAFAGTLTDEEKNVWLAGLKGAYNASDLNRVAAAVTEIAAELNSAGYKVEITPRTFAESDIIRRAQWATYLSNVQKLRDAYYTLEETGALPKPEEKLGYQGANTIEKVLADIDLLLEGMLTMYRRAGTFTSGGNYLRQMIRSI